GRATGELAALDDEGHELWSLRTGEPLHSLAVARTRDAALVFAGGASGAFALVDAESGASRGRGHLPGMVMAARPLSAGSGGAGGLVVGGLAEPPVRGLSGYVAVIGLDGRVRTRLPVAGQVIDVGAFDLDGDGEDELVAITGAYRLLVLAA